MDGDEEFTGKYEKEGRIGSLLVDAFYSAVAALLAPRLGGATTLLEVGCGAGYSTERLARLVPDGCDFLACDVGPSLVSAAKRRNPRVGMSRQSVYALAMPDKSVDVVVMLEVLEHLEDPARALAELQRVARRHVILSTPREPIWRALNFMRGKYMGALGNTPGHLQHWSSIGLQRAVRPRFRVEDMRQPLPWTILALAPAS